MNLLHFDLYEFDSPDLRGSHINMDSDFLKFLDEARDYADTPFKITSGFRTKKHNEAINGSPTSSHLKGLAVDIVCDNSVDRYKIINALILFDFMRIGIGKDFIHVDMDKDKPNVIWLYE